MLTELVSKNIITIVFVDVPFNIATRFYAKYFLYALQEQRNWETAVSTKRVLHDAAVMRGIKDEGKLEKYLAESGVKFTTFDVTPMIEEYKKLIREDEIKRVPTCVIVRGTQKKTVFGSDVRSALRAILEEAPKE
jgi:hypothetical protein